MTTSPDLIEAVARALFDAENDWRDMQGELGGPRMDDRMFKVTIVEWRMKARAALSAIGKAGFVLMPVEPTEEMKKRGEEQTEAWCAIEDIYAALLSARPRVT